MKERNEERKLKLLIILYTSLKLKLLPKHQFKKIIFLAITSLTDNFSLKSKAKYFGNNQITSPCSVK